MYCKHCGSRIETNSRFCTSCGAQHQQSDTATQGPPRPVSRPADGNATPVGNAVLPLRKKRSIAAILVAILVILVGLQFMLLGIVGKTHTASVTSVRQDRKSYGESSPNPNRYRIQYAFSVEGKSYEGSSSMIFKQGVRGDQKINIHYLPYYPSINSPVDKTNIMSGVLLTGFGTFLLVMGIQGKGRIQFKMGKRLSK